MPHNSHVAKLNEDFKTYQYRGQLKGWMEEVKATEKV
jgi:hypothetical protein